MAAQFESPDAAAIAHLGVGESVAGARNRWRCYILGKEKLLRFSAGERNAPEMQVRAVEERLAVRCPGNTRKTLRGRCTRHFARMLPIGSLHVDFSDTPADEHTRRCQILAVWRESGLPRMHAIRGRIRQNPLFGGFHVDQVNAKVLRGRVRFGDGRNRFSECQPLECIGKSKTSFRIAVFKNGHRPKLS